MSLPPATNQSATLRRVLLLSLRGSLDALEVEELNGLLDRASERDLRRTARKNRVEFVVGSAVARHFPDRISAEWKAALGENRRRVEQLLQAASRFGRALTSAAGEFAVIEGAGTLLMSDLPLESYSAGDIDVLVSEVCWEEAKQLLMADGFEVEDRRERPTKRLEFRKVEDGDELWIEIGSEPYDRMWVPLHHQSRSGVWLKNRVPAAKGDSLFVLSPVHSVVSGAMHASLHSFVRAPGLRLYLDIDRPVRTASINWEAVVEEVHEMDIASRAFHSLDLSRRLLETPIPKWVLERIQPKEPKRRWAARMLESEDVLDTGARKLPRGKALLLDALISERGILGWLREIFFPPSHWMAEHFDRQESGASPWRLHVRRYLSAMRRWKPQ